MKTGVALFLLMTVPSWAQPPSFDCAKAETETEKTICLDENHSIAMRDSILAGLFAAVNEAGEDQTILDTQSKWLKSRDACGSDSECLTSRYNERIIELARAAGDERNVTGVYRYQYADDTDQGEAFVVRQADGTLTGDIFTVAGPGYNTCEISFEAAPAIGDAWLSIQPGQPEDNSDACTILLRTGVDSFRVDSIGCRNSCGHNAYFDETYKRLK